MNGKIFDIQRFCIHDGPGIRTTVFLKGCNLRCLWCHNPESQSTKEEIMFYKDKCVGCGNCAKFCEKQITEKCTLCKKCVEICQNKAREIAGEEISAEEVVKKVLKDKAYYETSSGGVTLSGGEPLLQKDFAKKILSLCKEHGIHTAIETAGNVKWSVFEEILPVCDLVMFDIKTIDENTHKKCTGVSNKLILENANKLKASGKEILFRMPYIPQYNAEELPKIKEFANGFPLELMAYHDMAKGKYAALSREYLSENVTVPKKEEMQKEADRYNVIYSL